MRWWGYGWLERTPPQYTEWSCTACPPDTGDLVCPTGSRGLPLCWPSTPVRASGRTSVLGSSTPCRREERTLDHKYPPRSFFREWRRCPGISDSQCCSWSPCRFCQRTIQETSLSRQLGRSIILSHWIICYIEWNDVLSFPWIYLLILTTLSYQAWSPSFEKVENLGVNF